MLISDQLQTLMLWLMFASFLALLVGGMTNRFVVFYDSKDLMWTLSPLASLIIGSVVASSFVPEGGQFFDSALAMIFVAAGILGAVYGAYRTFLESMDHNGLVLGLIIGFFKVFIAVAVAILTIGYLNKVFSSSPHVSLGKRVIAAVFLAGLLWVVSKLINGEAYYASRGLVQSRS